MPTLLQPPNFGPGRGALVAYWSPAFQGDYTLIVPLEGSFQGDPVKGLSLLIDNYDGAFPVAYTISGVTDYVPAYTKEFVTVGDAGMLVLSATAQQNVNLQLWNVNRTGSASRGQPPNGLSDPLWGNVLGLWHFDGNPNATFAVDSKNAGLYIASQNALPIISSADSLFGGTSAFIPGTQGTGAWFNEYFSNVTIPQQPYTFEFAVKVKTYNAGVPNMIVDLGETFGSGPRDGAGLSFCYRYDVGNSNKLRFEVWRESGRGSGSPSYAMLFATPYQYDAGAVWSWHQIALVTIGTPTLYVDGVAQGGFGNAWALGGDINIGLFRSDLAPTNTNSYYFDECRLTLGARYTANYTVTGQEFPNQ